MMQVTLGLMTSSSRKSHSQERGAGERQPSAGAHPGGHFELASLADQTSTSRTGPVTTLSEHVPLQSSPLPVLRRSTRLRGRPV
jgi:hypothetical protein